MPDAAFPVLEIHSTSGLSFEWSEFTSRQGSTFDASFGHEGVGLGMCMLIRYADLELAIKELIGYSERDGSNPSDIKLQRHLPFAHPRWPQLWCTRITKVQGIQFLGKDEYNLTFSLDSGQVGGPVSTYTLILLTLQFSRPPYAILGDDDDLIYDESGDRQEWLRYTDRTWSPAIQILSREGMQFQYTEGAASGNFFPGSVGERLIKIKLTRTWYQIPQVGIYDDNGFPQKLFLGTDVTITGIIANGSGNCQVTAANHGFITGQTVLITGVVGTTKVNGVVVVTVINSSTFDTTAKFDATYTSGGIATTFALGSVNLVEFMGCPAGTLLYEVPEIIIRPLPIPPQLMGIVGESIQLQYDIKFHFEYFDPPIGSGVTKRGHNNMPWAADGLWYPVQASGKDLVVSPREPFPRTPFADLFNIM